MIARDQHPDIDLHNAIQRNAEICQVAIHHWRVQGEAIRVPRYGLTWTPDSARAFFHDLSNLMNAYNEVLWKGFSYCRLCEGKCCTNGVIEGVEAYDLVALALLEVDVPELPAQLNTRAGRCLYLDGGRCTWPEAWRVYKCWSYYCLGPSSVWGTMKDGKDLDQRYAEMHSALVPVIEAHLPEALRVYQWWHGVSFTVEAGSATGLGLQLQHAINAVLVRPLAAAYPQVGALFKPFEVEYEALFMT